MLQTDTSVAVVAAKNTSQHGSHITPRKLLMRQRLEKVLGHHGTIFIEKLTDSQLVKKFPAS